MKHRGEIIKDIVDNSRFTKRTVAKALNFSASKLYRLFEDPHVSLDIILAIGKVISYNFSKDFPELANREGPIHTESGSDYKNLYFEIIEKYLTVLEERDELLNLFYNKDTSAPRLRHAISLETVKQQ